MEPPLTKTRLATIDENRNPHELHVPGGKLFGLFGNGGAKSLIWRDPTDRHGRELMDLGIIGTDERKENWETPVGFGQMDKNT